MEKKGIIIHETTIQLSGDFRTQYNTVQREIIKTKKELYALKAHLEILSQEKGQRSNVEPTKHLKPRTSKVLFVSTSNTSNIDTSRLSSKFEITIETAYTISEAESAIKEQDQDPDVITFHVFGNEIKKSSSSDCASKLKCLVEETKNLNHQPKFLFHWPQIELMKNKYNLKVNTVNSIIKEMEEESQEFTICDHSNMSKSNQIKKNCIPLYLKIECTLPKMVLKC